MIEKGLLAGSLMAGQLLLAPMAVAGPEGGVVITGQGSITTTSPFDTQISQTSQNLLMNFDSFDVGVDEYECTPEGKKIAKSHAWQFLKPVKVCGKTIKY